jgi:hypothetical protein
MMRTTIIHATMFCQTLIWLLMILFTSAAIAQQPVIFNSNETAADGQVFGLQGTGFGEQPEVWYALLTGKERKLLPAAKLEIVSASSSNISARAPLGGQAVQEKLMAVWVKNGRHLSKPVFLNRARVVTVEYEELMPRQSFRLFGRNLYLNGYKPAVYLVATQGRDSLPAVAQVKDAYILEVTAPETIKKGVRYKIYITNGAGGRWGQTQADELVTGSAAAPDPFGLEVPWGADFTFAHNIWNVKTDSRLPIKAVGNGLADDRGALQAAIDLANKSGGGVVYLPAGTYRLDIPAGSGLVMRSNIVLKGDGPSSTIIRYGFGTSPPYPDPIGKGGWPDTTTEGVAILWPLNTSLTGLYNLAIQNVNTSGRWRHSLKNMQPPIKKPGAAGSRFFAAGCRFDLSVAWGLSWGYVDRMLITDCHFESAAQVTWPWLWHCNGSTNFVVRNNIVRYSAGRFGFNESYNGIIENNHITRLGDLQTAKGESGGFNIDYASDIVLLNNRMDVSGRNIEYHNQGETILSQGGQPKQMDTGVASGATAIGLTDKRKKWGPIKTVTLNSADAIAIVAGKGMGQWRRITTNNENTVTVDRPWEVVPDHSSHYVIMRWSAEDWLVKDNVLEGNNRGIWFYCGNTDVAIVNNKLINSEGIYLRADQRLAEGRYNLSWNTLVRGNTVINNDGLRPAFICNTLILVGRDSLHGTGSLGIEIRNNYVEAHQPNAASFVKGEGYFNEVSAKTPFIGNTTGIIGTIFEQNKVANADTAYRLSRSADQTIIQQPVYQNVKVRFSGPAAVVVADDKALGTSRVTDR